MRNSLLLLLSLLCFVACSDPEPKPVLRFHDGRLRIAQFTDIHLSVDDPVSAPVADTLLAVIAKERPDIKVGKINVDEEEELALQFGVSSIPALFVLENGKVVKQSLGALPEQDILKLLEG